MERLPFFCYLMGNGNFKAVVLMACRWMNIDRMNYELLFYHGLC